VLQRCRRPGVVEATLLQWHSIVAERVAKFHPTSEAESSDVSRFDSLLVAIRDLIELAMESEEKRFEPSNQPAKTIE
jgi:hypothetical protein